MVSAVSRIQYLGGPKPVVSLVRNKVLDSELIINDLYQEPKCVVYLPDK